MEHSPPLSKLPTERRRGSLTSLFVKVAVSLLLACLFAWLVERGGVPLIPNEAQFRRVVPSLVAVGVLLYLIAHVLRASRWRFLIRPIAPLRLGAVVSLNWIGFSAIFLLPLRLGEVVRPGLTRLRHGVSVTAGLGTVAVERVVDGLIASLCVAWGLYALQHSSSKDPFARHLPAYALSALAVFSVGLFVLGLLLWKRQGAHKLAEAIVGRFSTKSALWVGEKIDRLTSGFRSLSSFRLTAAFAAESIGYWALSAASMWALAVGCGLPLGYAHSIALTGILALGVLLPAGPGLFGNFQLSVLAGLKLYLGDTLTMERGAVFIFLLYAVQGLVILLPGVFLTFRLKVPLRALMSTSRSLTQFSARPGAPSAESVGAGSVDSEV